jgi:uncharacterized membrane protein YkoI
MRGPVACALRCFRRALCAFLRVREADTGDGVDDEEVATVDDGGSNGGGGGGVDGLPANAESIVLALSNNCAFSRVRDTDVYVVHGVAASTILSAGSGSSRVEADIVGDNALSLMICDDDDKDDDGGEDAATGTSFLLFFLVIGSTTGSVVSEGSAVETDIVDDAVPSLMACDDDEDDNDADACLACSSAIKRASSALTTLVVALSLHLAAVKWSGSGSLCFLKSCLVRLACLLNVTFAL